MYSPIPIKRNTKYGNNYWEVFGRKVNRNVRLFSDLEYDNWILIESNPLVETYCEQPILIRQLFEGKIVESILDMWVRYKNGREEFIEVKYSNELILNNKNSERSLRQTAVQKLWCENNGFIHSIRTEEDIRGNRILLSNMKAVTSYVKNRLQPIETDHKRIISSLQHTRIKISEIEKLNPSIAKDRVREAICWLIYDGKIKSNSNEVLISPELEVWIDEQDY